MFCEHAGDSRKCVGQREGEATNDFRVCERVGALCVCVCCQFAADL